ncbi:hypothetical protein OIU77_003644 [Salix suchowensis]|uniref:Secreted protein n=1 Tax=Salix suchowensis TaxID=1278906 RepID=A0ABQ9B3H1_9ROSI|nr:hypothetical protein OIU77_003644 [Salix suchowensis]KAJ6379031.1 hypothetical protein OIU78_029118 [Salix suchowensis]
MLIHHLDTLFRGILLKVTLLLKAMLHIRAGMVLLLLGKVVACLKDAWLRSVAAAFSMLASDQDHSGGCCDQLLIDSSGLGHNIMYRL